MRDFGDNAAITEQGALHRMPVTMVILAAIAFVLVAVGAVSESSIRQSIFLRTAVGLPGLLFGLGR